MYDVAAAIHVVIRSEQERERERERENGNMRKREIVGLVWRITYW